MKMTDLLFIIFQKKKLNSLLNGFKNISLEKFEEGTLSTKIIFCL